ncbi:hypothetical protein [Streptomyces sp. RKND-216]|uniref:DUF6919 domain-containing protein n=1 Tax=Streptomyces sp. RKND-216 TaxID=2562581 RepID=UPI001446C15E|nr:hypothetical protein [Streptomyces sp. RKND-216]
MPWAPRAERRRFKGARTLADLADLTVRELEAGHQLDVETLPLIPSLTAANQAGLVTTCSQPGERGTGADGLWWEQRAALEVFTADRDLCQRIKAAAVSAELMVAAHDPRTGATDAPVLITTRDGDPYTDFPVQLTPEELRNNWPGAHRHALSAAANAVHLVIYAFEYGPTGQRLWPFLDEITGRITPTAADMDCVDCGCTAASRCPGPCWWVWTAGTTAECSTCRYGDSRPEPDEPDENECVLCGAPFHHSGDYCTPACRAADRPGLNEDGNWPAPALTPLPAPASYSDEPPF